MERHDDCYNECNEVFIELVDFTSPGCRGMKLHITTVIGTNGKRSLELFALRMHTIILTTADLAAKEQIGIKCGGL